MSCLGLARNLHEFRRALVRLPSWSQLDRLLVQGRQIQSHILCRELEPASVRDALGTDWIARPIGI
jgi:hypothetical protein